MQKLLVMVILNRQIVIIGSGVSGLAAAEKLVKAGFEHVRILEATKRSGGRIKTSTLGKYLNCILCLVFKDFVVLFLSFVVCSLPRVYKR